MMKKNKKTIYDASLFKKIIGVVCLTIIFLIITIIIYIYNINVVALAVTFVFWLLSLLLLLFYIFFRTKKIIIFDDMIKIIYGGKTINILKSNIDKLLIVNYKSKKYLIIHTVGSDNDICDCNYVNYLSNAFVCSNRIIKFFENNNYSIRKQENDFVK